MGRKKEKEKLFPNHAFRNPIGNLMTMHFHICTMPFHKLHRFIDGYFSHNISCSLPRQINCFALSAFSAVIVNSIFHPHSNSPLDNCPALYHTVLIDTIQLGTERQ